MFLCDPCHAKSTCAAGERESRSRGACELCDELTVCWDCSGYRSDEMANNTVATGGLYAVLSAGLSAMGRLHPDTGFEVVQLGAEPTDSSSDWEPVELGPNQMVVKITYMNSPYVITVERLA